MVKLYTLLGNTDTESLPSSYSTSTTEYQIANKSTRGCGVYEIREPSPVSEHQPSDHHPTKQIQHLLNQATALCDDLDELIALHYCFYEAVESVYDLQREQASKTQKKGSKKSRDNPALSVFPLWLRERDITMLDAVHSLQESLRTTCKKSKGWAASMAPSKNF
jgi:hypothetical protein